MTLPVGGISAFLELQGAQQFQAGFNGATSAVQRAAGMVQRGSLAFRLMERSHIAVISSAGRAGRALVGLSNDAERATGVLGRSSDSASRLTQSLKGLAAGYVGVNMIKSTIDAANQAQQAIGGAESVFGQYADKVVADSKRAADAYGLSATQYQQNAALIGALFKNQGVASDQLAGKTKQMIGLAADLAATYGGDVTTAVESLTSAYKGEFDPLEKYGISLKQSTINAALAAKGQDKLTGSALAQAQQMATTTIILNQTASAQGQFARESDTLAGQQARAAAKWQELQAQIGTQLLPIVTRFFGFIQATALPILSSLTAFLSNNTTAVKYAAAAVLAFWAAWKAYRIALIVTGLLAIRKAVIGGVAAYKAAQVAGATSFAATAAASQAAAGAISISAIRSRAAWVGAMAGIGLAVGALIALPMLFGDAGDSAENAAANVQALTDTLDDQTGAITRNTDAWIAKNLAEKDAFTLGAEFGLSQETITRAAHGETDALNAVNGALVQHAVEMGKTGDHARSLLAAVGGTAAAVAEAKVQHKEAADSVAVYGRATDDATVSTDKQKSAVDELSDSIDSLIGKNIDYQESMIKSADAGVALAKSVSENGKSLDLNSEKGRANRDAILSVVSALTDQASAYAKQTGDVEGANEQLGANIGALADHAAALGLDRDQVYGLFSDIGALNYAQAVPTVTLNTDPYQSQREAVRADLEALGGAHATATVGLDASQAYSAMLSVLKIINAVRSFNHEKPLPIPAPPPGVHIGGGGTNAPTYGGGSYTPPPATGGGSSGGSGSSTAKSDDKWYKYKGVWYQGKAAYNGAVAADKAKGQNIVAYGKGANRQYGYGDEAFGSRQEAENARTAAVKQKAADDAQAVKDAATALDEVAGAADTTTAAVKSSSNALIGAAKAAGLHGAALVDATKKAAALVAKQQQIATLDKQIDAAQSAYADQVDQYNSDRSAFGGGIKGSFDITSAGQIAATEDRATSSLNTRSTPITKGTAASISAAQIIKDSDAAVAKARRFKDLLTKLAKGGLDKGTIMGLAAKGPDALPVAEALNTMTPTQLAHIASNSSTLDSLGAGLGKDLAEQYDRAGVNAALGLLNGLKSQRPALIAEMESLGDALAGAVKKSLQIKSPSKVMEALGKYTAQGFANGLSAKLPDVRVAGLAMAGASLPTGGSTTNVDKSRSVQVIVKPSAPLDEVGLATATVRRLTALGM